MSSQCTIEGCDKRIEKRNGVCEMHYYRFRRTGDYHLRPKTFKRRPVVFEIDSNNCFIVTSHPTLNTGYIQYTKGSARTSLHRKIYEECFGEIPKGLVVRHKCDVRNCINPEHLELGTQADNVMDTVKRGRTLRGESNPNSKLDNETVRTIKQMIASGKRNCEIVKSLNVNKSVVANIKCAGVWKHIISD